MHSLWGLKKKKKVLFCKNMTHKQDQMRTSLCGSHCNYLTVSNCGRAALLVQPA